MSLSVDTVQFGFDWGNKGTICLGAKPGDPLNEVEDPVFISTTKIGRSGGTLIEKRLKNKTFLWRKDSGIAQPEIYHPGCQSLIYIQLIGVGSMSGFIGSDSSGNPGGIKAATIGDYTMVVWYRRYSGNGSIAIDHRTTGTTWVELATSGTISPPDTGVYKYVIPFTVPGGSTRDLRIRCPLSDSMFSASAEIFGFALFQGTYNSSNAPEFNAGTEASLYDNITRYVKSADATLGHKEWDSLIQSENTATLEVNNIDHFNGNEVYLFSPKVVTDNPIANCVKAGTPFIMAYPNDGEFSDLGDTGYVCLWSGWLKELQITPGTERDHSATLVVYQGITQLERLDTPATVMYADIKATAITPINYVIKRGFRTPHSFAVFTLNVTPLSGGYLYESLDFIVSVPYVDVSGEPRPEPRFSFFYTERGDNALQVLRDIVAIDNSHLSLTASGVLFWAYYNTVVNYYDVDYRDFSDSNYTVFSDPYTVIKFIGNITGYDATNQVVIHSGERTFGRDTYPNVYSEGEFTQVNFNQGTGYPSYFVSGTVTLAYTVINSRADTIDTNNFNNIIGTATMTFLNSGPPYLEADYLSDTFIHAYIAWRYNMHLAKNSHDVTSTPPTYRYTFKATPIPAPPTAVEYIYADPDAGAQLGPNAIVYDNKYINDMTMLDIFINSKIRLYGRQHNFFDRLEYYVDKPTFASVSYLNTIFKPYCIIELSEAVTNTQKIDSDRHYLVGIGYEYRDHQLKRIFYLSPEVPEMFL